MLVVQSGQHHRPFLPALTQRGQQAASEALALRGRVNVELRHLERILQPHLRVFGTLLSDQRLEDNVVPPLAPCTAEPVCEPLDGPGQTG